jgi:hypothetical protein
VEGLEDGAVAHRDEGGRSEGPAQAGSVGPKGAPATHLPGVAAQASLDARWRRTWRSSTRNASTHSTSRPPTTTKATR